MIAIRKQLRLLVADERGATAIEYGLIAAILGVGLTAGLKSLGGGTGGMWTNLASLLGAAMP